MTKLLVIADDFTGAMDTGVQFSKKGVPTLVTTDRKGYLQAMDGKAEVLVIDIESRHSSSLEAYGRVAELVKGAVSAGIRYFYKKTDSTLRGNIGAELSALLNTYGGAQLAFIPAFPQNGRTTKNGIQYVNGTALTETVYAKDPFEPVKYSSVAQILREQSEILLENVPISRYEEAKKEYTEKTISIFDAETDGDMLRLGTILKSADRLRVLAGCAGFAAILPELLGLRTEKPAWEEHGGNILIVSGSVNPIALEQLDYAKKHGYASLTLSPAQKIHLPGEPVRCAETADAAAEALKRHKKVVLESVSSPKQIADAAQYAGQRGIPIENLHFLISQAIGKIVKGIRERVSVDNLVIFGGDTLFGIMEELDYDGIFPVLEIAPGVVAAKIISRGKSIHIITKSGSFGSRNVVGIIDHFILGERE